jgi:hypothetical protein
MLIPALLCDRCRDNVLVRTANTDSDDERELMRDAERCGWHVQRNVKDYTYGRAVCPLCRQADDRKDWA